MTIRSVQEVLNLAKAEILDLRRRNQLLDAKIEVMDLFICRHQCVLRAQTTHRSLGESIDVAREIQVELNRLAAAEANVDPDGDGIIETGEAAFNSAPTKPPSS